MTLSQDLFGQLNTPHAAGQPTQAMGRPKKIQIPQPPPWGRGRALWVPANPKDTRTCANWLIKMVRCLAAKDPAAQEWQAETGFSEDTLLPDTIMIPQYVHKSEQGQTHKGDFMDDAEHWRISVQWERIWEAVQANRDCPMIGKGRPLGCCVTHDGRPDPRVEGSNKYFLLFIWASDLPDVHEFAGAAPTNDGIKVQWKFPFYGDDKNFDATGPGTAGQVAAHLTHGHEASPKPSANKYAIHNKGDKLKAGPVPSPPGLSITQFYNPKTSTYIQVPAPLPHRGAAQGSATSSHAQEPFRPFRPRNYKEAGKGQPLQGPNDTETNIAQQKQGRFWSKGGRNGPWDERPRTPSHSPIRSNTEGDQREEVSTDNGGSAVYGR